MKCDCEDPGLGIGKTPEQGLYKITNTLQYNKNKCIGCGRCTEVCPHAVFTLDNGGGNPSGNKKKARLVNRTACMECGACMKNCPKDAIKVDAGVGCAAAMIWAALTRSKSASCGPTDDGSPSCCGGDTGKKKGCC